MLERIIPLLIEVSNYLGINPVPVVFDDIEIEDSRIYLKEEYIVISERFKNNYIECAKCVCHELRHLFQLYFVKISKDNKALRMKEELTSWFALDTNSKESITKYMMQEIEIDAYAFTKWYLKKYHNIDVMHPSNIYERIIESYIIKNFK